MLWEALTEPEFGAGKMKDPCSSHKRQARFGGGGHDP
jgi:hypothetical protein